MKGKRYIAVIDETGSNRPQEGERTFGVGAVLFPASLQKEVVDASKAIAELVGKKDFKYKHVRSSDAARSRFLRLFNSHGRKIRCYGFFTASGAAMEAERRDDEAEMAYEQYWTQHADSDGDRRHGLPVVARSCRIIP